MSSDRPGAGPTGTDPGGPGGHDARPTPTIESGPGRAEGGRGAVPGRARSVVHGAGVGARATGRGVRGVARATGRAGRFTLGQARRAARAEGADESGLSRLIEMHTFNAAGDAAVAIALAGTLFFQLPTGEARGQVALFLGLTMLPFAIVAPLIGPFLDRFSHGRRWAIGATMAVRAFLCWVLAGAATTSAPVLFPTALGVLVASKAYGVTRAAAVPRLRPSSLTLVRANARVSLAGVVGATVSAPVAVLAVTLGSDWALRYAFALFIVATVLAIRLPAQVDASAGERAMSMRERPDEPDDPYPDDPYPDDPDPDDPDPDDPDPGGDDAGGNDADTDDEAAYVETGDDSPSPGRRAVIAAEPTVPLQVRYRSEVEVGKPDEPDEPDERAHGDPQEPAASETARVAQSRRWGGRDRARATRIPTSVAFALRANCGPRWLSGFLVMFMAFLLRENPIEGWEDRPELLLGLVVAGAGLGNTLGIVAASLAKRLDAAVVVVAALVADAVMALLGAALYGVLTLFGLGLVAGLAQSLAKVSLDATIQEGVPPWVQASAFARSDTTLQLAWVVGGFVGIALPLIPQLGLGVAAAVLVAWGVVVISTRPGGARGTAGFLPL